jgi:multiple sugar transport system permease protein/putative aldouronate transport system permease protein
VFAALNGLFFTLFALLCAFPFYYLFINTISNNELVASGLVNLYPRGIHFENYLKLLNVRDIATSALVTAGRTVLGTALMVAASAFVGYLVSQKAMLARKTVYRYIIVTMYFNAGLIPWYLNMSMLGLTNNFWGYVIPAIVQPFNIILVKTYIESIPSELEESAFMDGAGYFTVFRKIIFPLCKPILATIAVFGAVGHWNSFIDSLILMSRAPQLHTLQHKLYIYLNTTNDLGKLMESGGTITSDMVNSVLNTRVVRLSVSVITVIPILLVYPFMQRYFQKGLMLGAVKG